MRRRAITWRLGLATAIAACAGCASLLGDYDVGSASGDDGGPAGDGANGTDGNVDGGTDSTGNDSASPDSSFDSPSNETSTLDAADGAPPLLTCKLSLVSPIQIESLAGAS